jgi:exosome complex exonuclease DIS3/RRP44
LTPRGHIRGVLKRQERLYCGHLEIEIPSLQPIICRFIPSDNRFPNFLVKTSQSMNLFNKRIQIKFDQWPENSLFPFGIFQNVVGEIGHIDTEQKVILLEHNVEFRPFSKAVLDCLPSDNYSIP